MWLRTEHVATSLLPMSTVTALQFSPQYVESSLLAPARVSADALSVCQDACWPRAPSLPTSCCCTITARAPTPSCKAMTGSLVLSSRAAVPWCCRARETICSRSGTRPLARSCIRSVRHTGGASQSHTCHDTDRPQTLEHRWRSSNPIPSSGTLPPAAPARAATFRYGTSSRECKCASCRA